MSQRQEREPPGAESARGKRSQPLLHVAGVGIELTLTVVLCMYAGFWLDRWLETKPWCFVAGAFIGMVVGFYGMARRLLMMVRPRNGSPG